MMMVTSITRSNRAGQTRARHQACFESSFKTGQNHRLIYLTPDCPGHIAVAATGTRGSTRLRPLQYRIPSELPFLATTGNPVCRDSLEISAENGVKLQKRQSTALNFFRKSLHLQYLSAVATFPPTLNESVTYKKHCFFGTLRAVIITDKAVSHQSF